VRFPTADSDETVIKIEGEDALATKILAAIQAFVDDRENQQSEHVEVEPSKHRMLIGHGGETRRQLEKEFGVSIDIPKQTVQGEARSRVRLSGRPESIEKARAHILELTKEEGGERVDVPRKMHHVIADNGSFFRRLRGDLKVTVDHAGQKPPARPANGGASGARARVNGSGAMPLITDDASGRGDADSHSWEIVDSSAADAEGEADGATIPWVLRGPAENVAKGRTQLERALQQAQQQAQQQSHVGYLILADPKSHRHVIGQGGSTINAIRKETGCRITVPKAGGDAAGEAIEVLGGRQGVERARELIMEAVMRGQA